MKFARLRYETRHRRILLGVFPTEREGKPLVEEKKFHSLRHDHSFSTALIGKSSLLKALLRRNFDTSASDASSSRMLFTPSQSLIELNEASPAPRGYTSTAADDRDGGSPGLGQKFIIKACDNRGLKDPNHKDEDIVHAIRSLYSSEFN